MLNKLLVTLFLCINSISGYAETSVWKVDSGKDTVYIGGTIHLLRDEDYPLPEEFYIAYKNSDRIVFETDITALSDPAVLEKTLMLMMAKPGETVDKLLSPETLEALRSAASEKGIDLNQLLRFKAGMIVTIIQLTELMRLGVTTDGVDTHFNKLAAKDDKPTGMLESIEEQSLILSGMGEGNEEEYVRLSLRDMDKLGSIFSDMTVSWREGNMKQDYPAIYNQLLVQRNSNWLPKIEVMFKQPGIEYLLVGTAHLIGEEGIIQRLKKKGYRITQINTDSP